MMEVKVNPRHPIISSSSRCLNKTQLRIHQEDTIVTNIPAANSDRIEVGNRQLQGSSKDINTPLSIRDKIHQVIIYHTH